MLSSFILAIVTHPEVQVRGQREIDSVVGRERLPDFNDQPFLPYITAIVKEVLRHVFSTILRFLLTPSPGGVRLLRSVRPRAIFTVESHLGIFTPSSHGHPR